MRISTFEKEMIGACQIPQYSQRKYFLSIKYYGIEKKGHLNFYHFQVYYP